MPTAFDGKYKAKPAYWAYVDATKLEPLIQDIVVAEQKGDTMSGTEYSFRMMIHRQLLFQHGIRMD